MSELGVTTEMFDRTFICKRPPKQNLGILFVG